MGGNRSVKARFENSKRPNGGRLFAFACSAKKTEPNLLSSEKLLKTFQPVHHFLSHNNASPGMKSLFMDCPGTVGERNLLNSFFTAVKRSVEVNRENWIRISRAGRFYMPAEKLLKSKRLNNIPTLSTLLLTICVLTHVICEENRLAFFGGHVI
jgi:hypothetical protein